MSNKVDQDLVAKAVDHIDRGRMIDLVVELVNIPSPTGFEGDMARAFPIDLESSELKPEVFELDSDQLS